MSKQNEKILKDLIKEITNQTFQFAENLRDEWKKYGKGDKHIWNNQMVPSFNYVKLAVKSVYSTGRSFGDFTQEQVETIINSQPKWEKSTNLFAQSAALIFPLK